MAEFSFPASDEAFAIKTLAARRAQATQIGASTSYGQKKQLALNVQSIRVKYPWLEAGVVSSLAQAGYDGNADITKYTATQLGVQKLLAQRMTQFGGPDTANDPLIQAALDHKAQIHQAAQQIVSGAKAAPDVPAYDPSTEIAPTQAQLIAMTAQNITAAQGRLAQLQTTGAQGVKALQRLGYANATPGVEPDDSLTALLKPVTRYAFAGLQAGWQAVEAGLRAGDVSAQVETRAFANQAQQTGGAAPPPELNPTPPALTSIAQAPIQEQTTLGQNLVEGQSMGSGWFPGGPAAEAQAASARAAAPTIGGHAWTVGRFLASTAGLQPNTTPFNIASGAVDAAAILKGDPAALALKGLGNAYQSSKMFEQSIPTAEDLAAHVGNVPTSSAADLAQTAQAPTFAAPAVGEDAAATILPKAGAPELPGGGSSTAINLADQTAGQQPGFVAGALQAITQHFKPQQWEDWTNTNKGQGFLQSVFDMRDNPANLRRYLSLNGQFPLREADGSNILDNVMQANSVEDVKAALSPVYGRGGMPVPDSANSLAWGTKQLTVDKRFLGIAPDHAADFRDPTQAIDNMDRWLLNADVPLTQRDAVLNKLILAKTGDDRFQGLMAVSDAVKQSLLAHGMNEVSATKLSRVFQETENASTLYTTAAAAGDLTSPLLMVNGQPFDLAHDPLLDSEHLAGGTIELPNARIIKRATSFGAHIFNNPDIPKTEQLADSFNALWKSGKIARPALTVRILADNFARMVATGLSTPFNHPLDWFSLYMGGKIDHPFLQRLAGLLPDSGLEAAAAHMNGTDVETVKALAGRDAQRIIDNANALKGAQDSGLSLADWYRDNPTASIATDPELKMLARAKGDLATLTDQIYRTRLKLGLTTNIGKFRGDITGVPLDWHGAFKDGFVRDMRRTGSGYSPTMRRIGLDSWDPVTSGHDRYAEGVLNELRQLNDSKVARAAMTYDNPQQVVDALTDGELAHIRRDQLAYMIPSLADGSPTMGQDLATYVSHVYDRIAYVTKNDPMLMNAARTGQWATGSSIMGDAAEQVQGRVAERLTSMFGQHNPSVLEDIKARAAANPSWGPDAAKVQRFYNLNPGEAAKSGVFKQTMNRLYSDMVTRPVREFVASPAWRQLYGEELEKVFPSLPPELRAKALQNARDVNMGSDVIRKLSDTPSIVDSADHPYALTIAQADFAAKANTSQRYINLIHDLSSHSQMAQSLRYVFPFLDAYKQILTKWATTAWEHPQTVYRAQQGIAAAKNAGVIYPDPTTGEEVFGVPGVAALSGVAGDPVPLSGKIAGLNLVTQGIPGTGPIFQIPMSYILQDFAPHLSGIPGATAATDFVSKQIFPYGNPAAGGTSSLIPSGVTEPSLNPLKWNLVGPLEGALPVPTSVQRMIDTWIHSPETYRDMATVTSRVMQYKASTGQYDLHGPNAVGEMNRLVRDSKQSAQYLNLIRAGVDFFLPTSVMPDYMVKDKTGNLAVVTTLSQDYQKMLKANGYDSTAALTAFIKKWGENNIIALQPLSAQTKGYLPSTPAALAWLEQNPKVRQSAPDVYGYFAPSGPKDSKDPQYQFDQQAFSLQFGRGERVPNTPEQVIQGANARLAQHLYDANTATLGNSKADQDLKSQYAAALAKDYPGFHATAFDYLKAPNTAAKIRDALKTPALAKSQAGQAATKFLAAYDDALANGTGKTFNTKANAQMGSLLYDYGAALAKDHPDFLPMWTQVFSHLVDTAAVKTYRTAA